MDEPFRVILITGFAVVTGLALFYRIRSFYTSFALDVVAVGLLMANWFVLLSGGLAMVMLALRTHREEQLLIERFGDAYRDYMGRTGRFLPRC